VIAHSVSVMTVQAGAVRRLPPGQEKSARRSSRWRRRDARRSPRCGGSSASCGPRLDAGVRAAARDGHDRLAARRRPGCRSPGRARDRRAAARAEGRRRPRGLSRRPGGADERAQTQGRPTRGSPCTGSRTPSSSRSRTTG
jgi:hypothetical protein